MPSKVQYNNLQADKYFITSLRIFELLRVWKSPKQTSQKSLKNLSAVTKSKGKKILALFGTHTIPLTYTSSRSVKINQSQCCLRLSPSLSFAHTFLCHALQSNALCDCNQNALWPCFIFSHYYFYCYCYSRDFSSLPLRTKCA